MRILSFLVNEQQLKKDSKCNFQNISKDTKGYLYAKFTFGKGWNGCRVAASFWCLNKEYPVIIEKDRICCIPEKALPWSNFNVSLTEIRDGYKITTNKVTIKQGE